MLSMDFNYIFIVRSIFFKVLMISGRYIIDFIDFYILYNISFKCILF